MKIAYKWLQEYIKTGLSPEELGEQFRLTSSEVEEIVNWNDRFSHLVIGHVESVAQHPRSDHLFLTQTRVGPNQVKSIVCGAPNVAAGQTVVVALPGATVIGHDGESHQIEETVIRGEQSEGMLCAADEIGLPEPEGEQGILVLSEKVPAGTPAAEALHLDDTVLDLEITPNRPDLLSYRGLARELATIEKKRLPEVPIYTYEPAHERQVNPIHISIEDSKLCSRYSAICLKNVTVQPSPQWMQSRLTLSGIRPINTVVDVTNYVMLELGQPLHAFDLDLLTTEPHPALKVRAAKAKERITLIGEKEKALAAGDIVIAGGKDQPIALAGIMGNASTGISQTTTRVLLESAVFSGPQIRRASRRLGIRTEASTRFEKGLDPEQTVTALKRAIYLLQEISTAELESGIIDVYPRVRIERPRIHLSFARIGQILGVHISPNEAKIILQHLGFQIPSLTKSSIEVIPPSWRKDVTLPEDVMEELIRIWGYNRLPSTLPVSQIVPPVVNRRYEDKNRIRRTLAAERFHEMIHLSLTSEAALKKIGLSADEAIRLPLPLSAETEYLIPNHLVNLLNSIAGQEAELNEACLFEIGHVFPPPAQEKELLSLICRSAADPESVYSELKRIIERLKTVLHLQDGQIATHTATQPFTFLQANTALDIAVSGQTIGQMGHLRADIIQNAKIRSAHTVVFLAVDLDILLALPKIHHSYRPEWQFPSVERDMTVVLPEDTTAHAVLDLLSATDIRQEWEITGIYRGQPLDRDQKSITVHFTYNGLNRTLSDEEVAADQKQLAHLFRQKLSAHITE